MSQLELNALIASSPLSADDTASALMAAFGTAGALAKKQFAEEQAALSDGAAMGDGRFFELLMKFLMKFLPVLLKLL